MKIREVIIGVIIAVVLFFAGYFSRGERVTHDTTLVIDTITLVTIDTVTVVKPIYITKTTIDTIRVPFYDTLHSKDTLYLNLPKEQKYYGQSGSYDAWVSGYSPALDSIRVFQRTITNTIHIKERRSRFGVGLLAGVGVGGDRVNPFIGVGLYFHLFELKL